MFFMGGDIRPVRRAMREPQVFANHYQCFSMAMIDKLNLDFGDKILLPPSALNQLSRMEVEYPMLFELSNETTGKKIHCGVREFTAEEGKVHLPYLMMQTLQV
jgi:ubiquitin fusion degradation protein 1